MFVSVFLCVCRCVCDGKFGVVFELCDCLCLYSGGVGESGDGDSSVTWVKLFGALFSTSVSVCPCECLCV